MLIFMKNKYVSLGFIEYILMYKKAILIYYRQLFVVVILWNGVLDNGLWNAWSMKWSVGRRCLRPVSAK